MNRLTFESNAVVVVAGVPGAGKTTLIRRSVDRRRVQVVDTDDRRDPSGRGPRFAGARHYARIVTALAGPRPVLVHSRGTHAALRRLVVRLAALHGRPAHLILLHAERPAAEAGQHDRGRTVPEGVMDREVGRWRRLLGRRERLEAEGWASIVLLERADAARVDLLDFAPAQASSDSRTGTTVATPVSTRISPALMPRPPRP